MCNGKEYYYVTRIYSRGKFKGILTLSRSLLENVRKKSANMRTAPRADKHIGE